MILHPDAIATAKPKAGQFILGNNLLAYLQLSNDRLLTEYKEQPSSERGFRFLQDPLFLSFSLVAILLDKAVQS
ncbi:MAG: hypothetical protein D6756_09400 [Cyanobacteria bacterium J083]|nr:MAG: hypothetical protein D6756_09400 [Cyanobacteria bacterium J083]